VLFWFVPNSFPAEAYLALGIPGEAQTAAAVLGHNFPESVWYKDAYALLQGGGLQPHEDQGSWISKAFHKMGFGYVDRTDPGNC
jgi:outer membrane protein assembly factor BamD